MKPHQNGCVPGGERPLPAYRVRVSDRAYNVRLTVTAKDGLVVVVPRGWRGDADALVASKRAWVERALARHAKRIALHAGGPEALLPATVELRLLGEHWRVERVAAEKPRVRERICGDERVLEIAGPSAQAQLAALQRWLSRRAASELPTRLLALAGAHGCAVARVRVTAARSRWGSCSAKGTVSLNRAVLFWTSELAEALMLHELAHLAVLDHSARFWEHLATLDPDARTNRERMRHVVEFVPAWAEA